MTTNVDEQMERISRENKFITNMLAIVDDFPNHIHTAAAEQKIPLTLDIVTSVASIRSKMTEPIDRIARTLEMQRRVDHRFGDEFIVLRQMILKGGIKNASDMIRKVLIPEPARTSLVNTEMQRMLIGDVLMSPDPSLAGVLLSLPNLHERHISIVICEAVYVIYDKGTRAASLLAALRFALDNAESQAYPGQKNKPVVVAMVHDMLIRLKEIHGKSLDEDLRTYELHEM